MGEIKTGSETCCPITVVVRSRLALAPITWGEPEFARRSHIVGDRQPLLTTSQERGVHDFGSRFLARLLCDGHGFEPDVTSHDYAGLSFACPSRRPRRKVEHHGLTPGMIDARPVWSAA